MSKSKKRENSENTHVAKSDVRHRFKVDELVDFTRRETRPDGSEKMAPRVAMLTPEGGGKQVRAYVPGNLTSPLEVGSTVLCRPHDKHHGDGPPVKFRITNVVDANAEAMTATQNAEFAESGRVQAAPVERRGDQQAERHSDRQTARAGR